MTCLDVSTTTKRELRPRGFRFLKILAAVILSSCVGSASLGDDDPDDAGGDAATLDGAAGDDSGGRTGIVGIIRPIDDGRTRRDAGGDLVDAGALVDGGAQAPPPVCECDGEPLPEADGDGAELPYCSDDRTGIIEGAHACGQGGECLPATVETECLDGCRMGDPFLGYSTRCS